MWTHFKGANKYTINNSMGQQVFLAEEKSDGLSRQVFGNRRSFDMEVTDNSGRSILHFNKTLDGLSEMRVKSPITGQLLGVIKEKFAMTKVVFEVFHPNGALILRIKGGCFGFVKGPFEIVRPSGQQEQLIVEPNGHVRSDRTEHIGDITKEWAGFMKEAFTDADNFRITFPMGLDPRIKATLLGAVVLIDFKCFESNPSHNRLQIRAQSN